MDRVQDDKKNAESRKPMKGIEAPLRDQIQKKLFKKLEDMKVGHKIVEIWEKGNADRAEWLKNQQKYLADLDVFVNQGSEGPFAGASDLHIPMPLWAAKALHARFLQAILAEEPPFTTKARREDSVHSAPVVQDTMAYAIRDWGNYYQGYDGELDQWLWHWVTTGSGIVKQRWECKYESYMDVVNVPVPVEPKTDEDGNVVAPASVQMKEQEKEVNDKVFEGPVLSTWMNEDVLVVGGKGDPQLADSVHCSEDLTASDLWTLVDRGIFDPDNVDEAIKSGPDNIMGRTNSNIKSDRATNAGKSSPDTNIDLDRYQILETYIALDVMGNGINSELVIWTHYKSKKILHANYLRRMNKTGERPIFKIDFHLRPGQDNGIGLLEMIHPLSVELDAMHNIRIDNGILTNMPFGFYRATSSIDPKPLALEPGMLIPLDNPQRDIYFPTFSNRTAWGMQEEQALFNYVERLTGTNDLILGSMTGSQGATRTATGARALLGESSANLDVYLRRLRRGWRRALRHLCHMLQQRCPKGLEFKVTGDNGQDYFRRIQSEKDLMGDFDFEVAENSSTSNPSMQQERAQQTLQLVMNPLLIQTGIVNAGNIYEGVKNHLKQQGVKDFGRFITKPAGWMYVPPPEAEANMILRGIEVPVLPEADHQGFIDYFALIMKDDNLAGQFTQEQFGLLAIQAKKHQQMLQALQQQQAQVANQQQMVQNAQTSQNQAPPGLNPMAGSSTPQGASNG
jgi:hypothetical protein